MKVFLSWSGERSKAMAAALHDWLPHVIQAAVPFFSPRDIGSGEFWDAKLRGEISESKFGVICVTQENVEAPWLNYEAGALAEGLQGQTAPWLLGMTPQALKSSPMSRLQARPADLEGTGAIIQSIAKCLERPIAESILHDALSLHWPKLERKLSAIPEATKPAPTNTDTELLQEILKNSQRILELQSQDSDGPLSRRLRLLTALGGEPTDLRWDPAAIAARLLRERASDAQLPGSAVVPNASPSGTRSEARSGAVRVVEDPKPGD